MPTEFAEFGQPDVFGDGVGSSKYVLPILSLNGKHILLVAHFGIGADPNELGKVNGTSSLSLALVVVVSELKCRRVTLGVRNEEENPGNLLLTTIEGLQPKKSPCVAFVGIM